MVDGVSVSGVGDAHGARAVERQTVYVYEAPVRIWHWVNALCIIVLFVTGYCIASPLPSTPGEASNSFLMGYIRFAHFSAGQVLAAVYLMRVYWVFAGNPHCRQIFYVPFWSKDYWAGVAHEAKWYLFLAKVPKKYVGHNPLAQLIMFSMFTLPIVFMIVTGFALYSEGEGIRLLAAQGIRLGLLDLAEQSGSPHLPSPRHVGAGRLHDHPHLRCGARGHSEPPEHHLLDDFG